MADNSNPYPFLGSVSGMAGSLLSGVGTMGLGSFFNLGGLMGGLFGGDEPFIQGIGNPSAYIGPYGDLIGYANMGYVTRQDYGSGDFATNSYTDFDPIGTSLSSVFNTPQQRALLQQLINQYPADIPGYTSDSSGNVTYANMTASQLIQQKLNEANLTSLLGGGLQGANMAQALLSGESSDSSSGGTTINRPKYPIQQPSSVEIPIPQQQTLHQPTVNPAQAYMASQQDVFNRSQPRPGSITDLARTKPDEVMRQQYMNQVYNNLLMKQFGA